jgi:two-component system chemotaxis response regulator CheB
MRCFGAGGRRMSPARTGPIRVMIVDDSAAVRRALSDIVASDRGLEVMATAGDPYAAVEKMNREMPDVMILDIELPRMDGITFLKRIMAQNPIPVVICSSHTTHGSEAMLHALEAGAVEVIEKPAMSSQAAFHESARAICRAVHAAAVARLSNLRRRSAPPAPPAPPRQSADAVIAPITESLRPGVMARIPRTERIICLGASTGGPEALKAVLERLPADTPGIVVVQHMPAGFTAAFARRLDGLCAMAVKEACDGDTIARGRVLIAPGNLHMTVQRRNGSYTVSVFDGPAVSRHKPSVDVLFRSAAQAAGPNATGALLTGMGDDGATGLLEMRQMGATTIAQDEATCVVFGMPKEAIARGAVDVVLPLDRIAGALGMADPRRAARG